MGCTSPLVQLYWFQDVEIGGGKWKGKNRKLEEIVG